MLGKRSGGYRARALSAGYRPIWEQGRRRLAPVSSLTGFSEIVEHIALLLSQGGNDSHDAFDKTTSGVTLGSEARIAPQHTRTDLPFTWIVGRLDASDAHEGPQGGFTLENVTASSSGFVVFAGGALAEQLTDFLCNGLHLFLEGSPAQCSSAHLMPAGKHQLGLNQDSFANALRLAAALDESLEVAQQVCPAQLAQVHGQPRCSKIRPEGENAVTCVP